MEYFFSQHALEQMHLRGISKSLVESILKEPEQRIEEEHLTVFQSIRADDTKETLLIRVFVNEKKTPNVVILNLTKNATHFSVRFSYTDRNR